jgi:phage baseplate assembly protein W
MLPDFGTPLRELLFEPNDQRLEQRAREMIIQSIRAWEPRITVEQIQVYSKFDEESLSPDDPRQDLDNILGIRIVFFDPQNISEVDELKLELPLGGSNA